jgi:hypothetical protein
MAVVEQRRRVAMQIPWKKAYMLQRYATPIIARRILL